MTSQTYTTEDLLRCYHGDLDYAYRSGGSTQVNHYSSGTPYFHNDDEAQEYLSAIKSVIEQSYNNPRARSLSILLEQEREDYRVLCEQADKLKSLLDIARCMLNRRDSELLTHHAKVIGINL